MKTKLALAGLAMAGLPFGQTLQASLANTGADVIGGMDQNWSVTSSPYNGPAFLATSSTSWPFSTGGGPWVADDATSSWITYSSPLNLNAPAAAYTYTETFTLTQAETLGVRFLSDNESSLYLLSGSQKTLIGTKGPAYDPSTFSMWGSYDYLNLGSGTYSFQIQVINDIWPYMDGNPTGVRFEETEVVSPVPEPASLVAGVLVLIPLGIGLLRGLRKEGGVLKLS